ncbi:uncharacterized protein TEOVI_000445800 [Trypanosoma equiperdum]|uniref:DUF7883 domain-containing protein n=2 Tax=Trypanozoon TaxID=39700 RepID=Q57XQ2_TRYB2|nr:hypothetical protein, conserved [Trypanosoma brucei brucei TREU927]AAX69617.1 hypothetical protein, conserved [Trypanosoma brucei]AAZ12286.1 hypothetical protein, conserved [Trypanosoma brucei brucei TREU927]SCU72874.1 hypothetical protein, conserved [Trypanosoma equiperdum]
MRGFRSNPHSAVTMACGALLNSMRLRLTQKEDDMLWENMRVILRRHGALPLPRVSALLSDEMLELVSNNTGGLGQYVKERPSKFQVEVASSGLTVVMLASELRRAGSSTPLIAKVLANVAASPQQQLSVSQLYRSLPALEQRKCGNERLLEAFLLQHASLVLVQNGIVKASPTSFVTRMGLNPIPPTSTSNPLAASAPAFSTAGHATRQAESIHESTLTISAFDDPKLNRILLLLQKTVPFSFYIPLRSVMQSPRSGMCFSPDATLKEILEELQRVPATILDCRVTGDDINDVFLRMMDADRRPYVGSEALSAQGFEVLNLGQPLIEAFRNFASASPENLQRLRSGIAMTELDDVLPSDLMERLHIYPATHKDAACIFVFDRLRHLFDVNMTAYMVRPWEVMERHEQPSSLTWQTTPIPVVLRQCLQLLGEKPLSVEELVASLSTSSRGQLQCAYASVEAFVKQHSLYLLLKEGFVWTPFLAAASHGVRIPASSAGARSVCGPGRQLSEKEKARMLMQVMPIEHPVLWTRFRHSPAARELPFDVWECKQEFFERHREFFKIYEVIFSTVLVVGRRDGQPPPAELLHSPCRTLADLVRLIAMFTVGGAQEATVLNYLPRDARQLVRRYGSIVLIARQLPMWFDVRGDESGSGTGSAIISYIGADGGSREQ